MPALALASVETLKLTRFTKSDWELFSGAEKFREGGDPFIGQFGEDWTLLYDAHAVSLISATEAGQREYAFFGDAAELVARLDLLAFIGPARVEMAIRQLKWLQIM